MNYEKLAQTVIENVGGEQNISGLVHCATRLRFNLDDESKVNAKALKATAGVMGVVSKGGQFQVIIGSDVGNVYKEITSQIDIQDGAPKPKNNQSKVSLVIDTITGIFTPILPAITAAGMIKAILSLLIVFKVMTAQDQSYQVLSFMADAAFYFLPILLAASAARKFNTNMYLAMMLGGVLLHPNFVAMTKTAAETGGIHFLGMPIAAVSYASSVIPIILTVWLMSFVEPIADKFSPKSVKFFTKPLITILVVGTASLVVIGPFGYAVSDAISNGIKYLESFSPWLVPLIVGGFTPLLVATGTHYGLIPIGINNRMTNGYDTVVYPGMLASNVGQGAAALAVALKSKKSEVKQLASSAGLTAILGITEPALYGVNLRFKTPLYAAMIGGGVGGFFMGIMGTRNFTGGSPGLITLPSYIGEDTLVHFYSAIAGAAISIVISFVVSYVLYKDEVTEAPVAPTEINVDALHDTLVAPMDGHSVALSTVKDAMFSQEILGQGVGIIPSSNEVYAPVSGVVSAVFETKHAIGITDDAGVEILIHVGIDTVQMGGTGFAYHVEKDARIEKGDHLMSLNVEVIKEHGYDPTTMMVITNSDSLGDILVTTDRDVHVGDALIKIVK